MSYCVVATYGNTQRVRWCSGVPDKGQAEKCREVAVEKGFTDAEVWREKDWKEDCQARQRGEARPRRAHS